MGNGALMEGQLGQRVLQPPSNQNDRNETSKFPRHWVDVLSILWMFPYIFEIM